MTTTLTDAQVEHFDRDGFLFPITAMSAEEAGRYRSRLETLERDYGARDLGVPVSHYLLGGSAHVVLPLAAEICAHPAILDAVEGILGPDLLVWGTSFFIKEPGDGKVVTWHQDLTYWGLGETSHQVTAWLALSDATPASGCMRFVAGSHKNALVPHKDTFADDNLLSRGQEIAVEVDEAQATDIVLAPGQFSLHHGLMFHSSRANRAADRRIGLAIRYVNPHVRQHEGEHDYALLVRGNDWAEHFIHIDAAPDAFAAETLALHDEIAESRAPVNYRGALHAGTAR